MVFDNIVKWWYFTGIMATRTISEVLRKRIRSGELSYSQIAQRSGVDISCISRFAHEQRSLNLKAADRLARLFDLELEPANPKRSGKQLRRKG